MTRFTARFTMLSWWHVGTGESVPGRSDDRQVMEEDRPIIPSTTIKGVARDEGSDIDELLNTEFAQIVFGSKRREGKTGFGSGRTDQDLTPVVSRHNRVDRETGRVADNYFFDAEVIGGGVLDAAIEPGTDDTGELALLAASLLAIERLGSRRTRGWGRCRVTLHDPTTDEDISKSLLEGLGGEIR